MNGFLPNESDQHHHDILYFLTEDIFTTSGKISAFSILI